MIPEISQDNDNHIQPSWDILGYFIHGLAQSSWNILKWYDWYAELLHLSSYRRPASYIAVTPGQITNSGNTYLDAKPWTQGERRLTIHHSLAAMCLSIFDLEVNVSLSIVQKILALYESRNIDDQNKWHWTISGSQSLPKSSRRRSNKNTTNNHYKKNDTIKI